MKYLELAGLLIIFGAILLTRLPIDAWIIQVAALVGVTCVLLASAARNTFLVSVLYVALIALLVAVARTFFLEPTLIHIIGATLVVGWLSSHLLAIMVSPRPRQNTD